MKNRSNEIRTNEIRIRREPSVYEYLKPEFKKLMSGLSESVEKCTKS